MLQSVGLPGFASQHHAPMLGSPDGRDASDGIRLRAGGSTRRHRNAGELARLRRSLARDLHSRNSERVMAGLIGLLALCENVSEKKRKPELSLADIQRKIRAGEGRPHDALRAFGARPLRCVDAPALYAILVEICVRAGLKRVPELFLLPFPGMNAYALGGPANACITVTEGLLRGLSRQEIAGIFAHEVAHVLHHDAGAMKWAAAIQREITDLAMRGIGDLAARDQDFARIGPQALLLVAAPVMAQLLISALSRVRELAADSRAIDLSEHPKALVDALCKLEYFHTGLSPLQAHMRDGSLVRALHSHPGTWERIAHLS